MSYTYFPEQEWGETDEDRPSLNVANGNAHIPAEMMGVDFEAYGIPVSKLDSSLLRLTTAYVPAHTRETVETHNPGEARMIFCGVTEDQAEHYRTTLIKIVEYCKEHNLNLVWG